MCGLMSDLVILWSYMTRMSFSHQPGQRLNNPKKKKKEKRPKQTVQRQELKHSRDKNTNNDKDVSSTNPIPSSQKQEKSQEKSQENPTVKKTPTRLPDIRRFYNTLTGKRKTTDTTPEKNTNEKKTNSNS